MNAHNRGLLLAAVTVFIAVLASLVFFGSATGDGEYTVYVEETGEYYETLEDAVNGAVDGGYDTATITLTAEKEYEMDFDFRSCNLSITGQGKGTVIHKADYLVYGIQNIAFKDLTLRTDGGKYCGFQAAEMEYYENVQIENTLWTYGKLSVFEKCTFIPEENVYGIWCYGSCNLIVDNCVFNSRGKAILIYNEGRNGNVEIRNTVFNDSAEPGKYEKAAVEVHTEWLPGYNIAIDNCVANGFSDKGSCGNNLWNACDNYTDEKSTTSLVVVNGVTELVPEDVTATVVNENGTKRFATPEAAFSAAMPGDTLILLEDATLPVGFKKNITISGIKTEHEANGYELTQLTVGSTMPSSAYMRLRIVSSSHVEAEGVVTFEECDVAADIAPGKGSAVFSGTVFDIDGKIIAGTAAIADAEGKAAAEERLAEYHVLGELPSGEFKVFYTITLDLGDGMTDILYAAYGENLPNLKEIPEKPGYTFDGFYLDEVQYYNADGKAVHENNLEPNMVLTAKWSISPSPETCEVTFDKNGGDTEAVPKTIEETCGSKYILPTTEPTRGGYRFVGWFTAPEGGIEIRSDTICVTAENHTLYAKWEANEETVKLNSYGGTDGEMKIDYDSDALKSITHATKTGYTLDGYYDGGTKVLNADGTFAGDNIGEWIVDGKWKKDGDSELTAKWVIEIQPEEPTTKPGEEAAFELPSRVTTVTSVTVDGKELNPGEDYETRGTALLTLSNDNGKKIVLLSGFTKTLSAGTHVLEANADSDVIHSEFTIASSTPVPPEPVPTPTYYEVSYDIIGGSEPGPGTMLYEEGALTYVAPYVGFKDGYTFSGWQCNGKVYRAGDEFIVSGDMRFAAIWVPNSNPVPEPSEDNAGIIAGIVAAAIVAVILIGAVVYFMRKK